MQQYTLNPIARAIGKDPKAFTKADITKYILDTTSTSSTSAIQQLMGVSRG